MDSFIFPRISHDDEEVNGLRQLPSRASAVVREATQDKQGTRMNKIFAGALLALTLTGCATHKEWSATGGSRADGVVRLSFEHGAFEKPVLDESQALSLATKRCATWGYTGAEAFGGTTSQCNMGGGFGGCDRFLVTKEYQCTGQGNGQVPSVQVPANSGDGASVPVGKKWF